MTLRQKMYRYRFLFRLLYVVSSSACYSQVVPPSSISFGGGSANYFGELNPYEAPIHAISGPSLRWNFSATYGKSLTNRLSANLGISYIRIFGDDNLLENITSQEVNYIRNLHFRNDLQELSAKLVYQLANVPRNFTRRQVWMPYLTGGISVFHHNPQARDVRDDPKTVSAWVNLRPLKTEGQLKPYSPFGLAIPIGLGLKYRLGPYLDLSVELTYNFTLTDYLDDVRGRADLENASALANRSLELTGAYSGKDRSSKLFDYLTKNGYPIQDVVDIPFQFDTGIPPFDQDGVLRGNSRTKDSYLLTKVSLIFYLAPQVKCPRIN